MNVEKKTDLKGNRHWYVNGQYVGMCRADAVAHIEAIAKECSEVLKRLADK